MKIEDILRSLEQEKVKYAVVGGVAVVIYGYVRFTKDIDLVIDFTKENIERFAKAMERLNFKPGPPIEIIDIANEDKRKEWISEKNAKVITFYNPDYPLIQIDILLTTDLSQIKIVRKMIDDFEISHKSFAQKRLVQNNDPVPISFGRDLLCFIHQLKIDTPVC